MRLRLTFLADSRRVLADRLRQLNEEFRVEVRRVSDEIVAARLLRGERLQAPEEIRIQAEDQREEVSRRAKERLAQIDKAESEAVKELTSAVALHPVKGKRLRELQRAIEGLEEKIEALESQISQLGELMGG